MPHRAGALAARLGALYARDELLAAPRGEIAALDVADLDGETVCVPRSETGLRGRSDAAYLGRHGRAAIERWLDWAGIWSGALFRRVDRWGNVGGRLAPVGVAAVVRERAGAAGIHGVTGQSLRVGSAVELAERGALLAGIQQAGRRQSPTMPGRYARAAQAAPGAMARIQDGKTHEDGPGDDCPGSARV